MTRKPTDAAWSSMRSISSFGSEWRRYIIPWFSREGAEDLTMSGGGGLVSETGIVTQEAEEGIHLTLGEIRVSALRMAEDLIQIKTCS